MIFNRIATLTIICQFISSSLQSSFIQDDILAFPRYKVMVTREKVSNTDISLREDNSPENSIIMTSSLGQPFSCILPNVQIEQERIEREKKASEQEEPEQDKQKTIERGLELLEPLGVNCIRFMTNTQQYWSYEYCHNQYIRQFHIERVHNGKAEQEIETASFYLGFYSGLSSTEIQNIMNWESKHKRNIAKPSQAKAPTQLKNQADERYLVQKWASGSVCDLTEKPRTVEVQYHCNRQGPDRVSSFIEVSTCNYQITISTPRLCEEMGLSRRHHIEPHKIKCRPIVSDKVLEEEKKMQEQLKIQEEQTNVPQEPLVEQEEERDVLLDKIADLTKEIDQLKMQLKSKLSDKNIQAEVSFLTIDELGNIIPGADITKLITDISKLTANSKQNNKVSDKDEKEPSEQHKNKQAYHQKYIAID